MQVGLDHRAQPSSSMTVSNSLIQAIRQEVVGQEYTIAAARAVTLAMAGIVPTHRPLAVLLFLGPPGSGKTYLAPSSARLMLGDESWMSQTVNDWPMTATRSQVFIGNL